MACMSSSESQIKGVPLTTTKCRKIELNKSLNYTYSFYYMNLFGQTLVSLDINHLGKMNNTWGQFCFSVNECSRMQISKTR